MDMIHGLQEYTLKDGVRVCRYIEKQLRGKAHTALTGSVLYKGRSTNDIDILVYPHDDVLTARGIMWLLRTIHGLGIKRMYWDDPSFDTDYPAYRKIAKGSLLLGGRVYEIDFFIIEYVREEIPENER